MLQANEKKQKNGIQIPETVFEYLLNIGVFEYTVFDAASIGKN